MSARSKKRVAASAWERFVALPDEDRRELINGVLVETEMPTFLHELLVTRIVFEFQLWVREHGGVALVSGYKLFVDERHGFMPDVQLFHPQNRAVFAKQGLSHGTPDIAVEVLSEGSDRYDRNAKLLGYARLGVGEYWIVSPDAGSIERLVLRRGKYVVEQVASGKDTVTPPKFPGLKVSVAELFKEPKARPTPRR